MSLAPVLLLASAKVGPGRPPSPSRAQSIDFPAGAAAIARQKLLLPDLPTFRLLIDSAGVLTRRAIVGRGVQAYVNGSAAIQYHYPVPDSLAARFRGASVVEGADNRVHGFRWDQKKLSEAPPICPLT